MVEELAKAEEEFTEETKHVGIDELARNEELVDVDDDTLEYLKKEENLTIANEGKEE